MKSFKAVSCVCACLFALVLCVSGSATCQADEVEAPVLTSTQA